jgi:hypothetical protein
MNDSAESQDPVAALPDSPPEEVSFEASLERAFAQFEGTEETPEPILEQEQPTPDPEPVENETTTDDPIEQLDDNVGNDWTPEAAKRFKQLKQELKDYKSQLQELNQAKTQYETQIQELKGLTENKDYEQLQQKVEEYEKRQMFVDLEQTMAYQKSIAEPIRKLLGEAAQVAEKYDIESSAIIDVLSIADADLQEERLAELMPQASDRDKAKIYNILERIDPLVQRREEMMKDTQQAIAEAKLVEEQHNRAEMAERARLRSTVTRNVVERIQQKLPFLANIEGIDISKIEQESAAVDPSTLHAVDHVYNSVSAKLFPKIIREYVSLKKELDTITDRLAEYEKAEPQMSGRSNNTRASQTSGSFIDRVNSAFSGI